MQALPKMYIIPPAPYTFRGDFSFVEASPTHLLYFNGPTAILRSYTKTHPTLAITHKSTITAVKFSPDYRRVATIDDKGTLMVHMIIDNKQVRMEYTYDNLYTGARAMDWSPDSKRVAVVGSAKNKHGRVVLIETGVDAGKIQNASMPLTAVAFRTQRPYKLSAGGDQHAIKFYQGPPYKFQRQKSTHTSYINQLKFNPKSQTLVSVGSDRKIVIYNGSTFEVNKQIINAHEGSVLGVTWINNQYFITCSPDKKIKKWKSDGELVSQVVTVVEEEKGLIDAFGVGVSNCGDRVFCVLLSGEVKEFDGKLGGIVGSYEGYRNRLTKILTIPDHKDKLILVDSNGKLLLTDLQTQITTRLCRRSLCYNRILLDACLNNNGNLYYLSGEGAIFYININKNSQDQIQKKVLSGHQCQGIKFIACVDSEEGDVEAFVTFGGCMAKVWIRDGDMAKKVGEQKLAEQPTTILGTYSKQTQSTIIFVGSLKGNIQILTISQSPTPKISFSTSFQSNPSKITTITYTHPHILIGDSMGLITVWNYNPTNNNEITKQCSLNCHTTMITSIFIIDDTIHSYGLDNKHIIWNRSNWMRNSTIGEVHVHGVYGAVGASGKIVTWGGDNLVKVWDYV